MRAIDDADRRDNPSDPIKSLIAVGVLFGGGYLVYQHGEADLQAGRPTGLAAFAHSLDQMFSGAAGAVNTSGGTGQGGTTNAPMQPSAPSVGTDPLSIYHSAQAAGVTDANSPASIPFGRALWAYQHGGDGSGYDSAPPNIQANWRSVAIHGG